MREVEKFNTGDEILKYIVENLSEVLTAKSAVCETIPNAPDEITFTSVNFAPNRARDFYPDCRTAVLSNCFKRFFRRQTAFIGRNRDARIGFTFNLTPD